MKLPIKLGKRLEKRKNENSFRQLPKDRDLIDFFSNDYLGLAVSGEIYQKATKLLEDQNLVKNGATGSRLLSGNNMLYKKAEDLVSTFHSSEAALIFNSGYDANLGFFSSVPQRGDFVIYDELVHASIRDGISMGVAKSYKFRHNDIQDIRKILKIISRKEEESVIYIVTESIFSMDGDKGDILSIFELCKEKGCRLVIDEAHASGLYGKSGRGLIQELGLEDFIFARIHTFGKALGCHGAAILGSVELIDYLVNFARSFIYTTALPPHSLATVISVYENLNKDLGIYKDIENLKNNIRFFRDQILTLGLQEFFIQSNSAIHSCIISGNEKVKNISQKLATEGFEVKPILSPTVPQGKERLRFCIHSYNSFPEMEQVLAHLAIFIKQ